MKHSRDLSWLGWLVNLCVTTAAIGHASKSSCYSATLMAPCIAFLFNITSYKTKFGCQAKKYPEAKTTLP